MQPSLTLSTSFLSAVVWRVELTTSRLPKPLSGRLSDRLGCKPMIVAGLFLCAVTLPAIPAFASFWLLLPASALYGLGVAIVTPSTTALVADLVRAGRLGSAMGLFGTIWDSGEAAGPILAGLLHASLSYTPAFGLIAAFMAAMALLFLMMVKDPTLPIPAGGRPTA